MAGLEGKSAEEIESLASLADSLANNPKTRRGFLSLTKQANPDAHIPEIDIPAQIGGLMAEPLKRLEAAENELRQRDIRDRIEQQRRELGLSREELAAVEKTMVDHKIADHATAKTFMDMQRRQAEPTPASTATGMRRFGPPTMPEIKPGADLKSHAYTSAYGVIDELRGRRTA